MFEIPEAVLAYWERKAKPKATPDELDALENYLGAPVDAAYAEFVTRYGYVLFPDRFAESGGFDGFEARFDEGSQSVVRQGGISFMMRIPNVIAGHREMTADAPADAEPGDPDVWQPAFPSEYLPFASDAGQDTLLMKLGEQAGEIWYWRFDEHPWGQPENNTLGYVAGDFTSFINGLAPYGAS